MSPTIRVDDQVFGTLQRNARPFVDTPNDVLRGLFGLNGTKPDSKVLDAEPVLTSPPAVIDDPVMLIRINQSYRPGMTSNELYQATRFAWNVSERRERARFACPVYNGIVLEVYEIHLWRKASPPEVETWKRQRWEFDGAPADETVRSKYLGRRVTSYLPRGFQGPIRFVNC